MCVSAYVLPWATGVGAEEAAPLVVVLLLDALAPDCTTETQTHTGLFYHSQVWNQLILIYFLKEMNAFTQQGCITFIKSDSKDIYNVSKDFYF